MDYTLANFFLYYHNWTLLTLDFSFFMLIIDSVAKINPDINLVTFTWFKDDIIVPIVKELKI